MKRSQSKQKTIPRFFLASSLDPAILLQPARLNRDLSHWLERKTWRSAIQQNRQKWRECRLLLKVTAVTFREHLAKNLQDLPLDDNQRQQALALCQSAPNNSLFWDAVHSAENVVWPRSLDNDLDAELRVWNGQYFRECFAQHRKSVPSRWVQAASDVLFALIVLKENAVSHISARSHLLQIRWEQGRFEALLAAVQEELPAAWVKQAIRELEQQEKEGETPGKRKRARALLKRIQKARTAIGKGNTEHLSPEEKPKSKRAAVARSKALRRLLRKHRQETEFHGDAWKVAQDIASTFQDDGRLSGKYQRQLVVRAFRQRVRADRSKNAR